MRTTILITVTALSISACGRDLTEQSILGGGAGALAGAVVSSEPLVGAVLGAAANALYCQRSGNTCR